MRIWVRTPSPGSQARSGGEGEISAWLIGCLKDLHLKSVLKEICKTCLKRSVLKEQEHYWAPFCPLPGGE